MHLFLFFNPRDKGTPSSLKERAGRTNTAGVLADVVKDVFKAMGTTGSISCSVSFLFFFEPLVCRNLNPARIIRGMPFLTSSRVLAWYYCNLIHLNMLLFIGCDIVYVAEYLEMLWLHSELPFSCFYAHLDALHSQFFFFHARLRCLLSYVKKNKCTKHGQTSNKL